MFLYDFPEVVARLVDKSQKNLTAGSGKKIKVLCNGCSKCKEKHETEVFVFSLTSKGNPNACTTCSRGGCSCNFLQAKGSAQLLSEYSDKNQKPASEYSFSSKKKVIWKCDKGKCDCHEWEATISNRTNAKLSSGCPFCSGHQCCKHTSFGAKAPPDVRKEWDDEKNKGVDIMTVALQSNIKYWFKCSTCDCSWNASPNRRLGVNKSGCPQCCESKMERAMREVLKEMKGQTYSEHWKFVSFKRQVPLIHRDGSNTQKVDFVAKFKHKETKKIKKMDIETDGIQHFEPVSFGSEEPNAAEKNLATNQCNDARKDKRLAKMKDHVLLRICYKIPFEDYEHVVKGCISRLDDDNFKCMKEGPSYIQKKKTTSKKKKRKKRKKPPVDYDSDDSDARPRRGPMDYFTF